MSKENKTQPFAGYSGSPPEPVIEPEPPVEPPVEPEPVKMVPKWITCTRCKGTGTWVSSRTGVRRKTAFGKLADPKRKCPRCRGRKTVVITITEKQAKAEKAERAAIRKQARDAIDRKARAAKAALDNE